MIKKIVLCTVVVLFTLLFSCRTTKTGINMSTSATLNTPNVSSMFGVVDNSSNYFNLDSFSQAFKSLFSHSDEVEKQEVHSDVNISDYDELIKRISVEHGYDWRYISAIAYNESRFNPKAISRVGAQGMMQIMPIVAREFNVIDDEIFKPEVNLKVALQLLSKLERMLKFPEHVSDVDRKSIVLACYNGGYGHVTDARRLARKYGANPNSWEDVADFLKKKAHPEYHLDEVVWYGNFNGSGETLTFVDRVLSRYDHYCQL